ncbi:MAG: VCBS repeat-containing protein [Polyangiaceae bacterium]
MRVRNFSIFLLMCGVGLGASCSASEGGGAKPSGGTGGGSAGAADAQGTGGSITVDAGSDSPTSCTGASECPKGTLCKYELCIPNLGKCTTHDDCPGDSYCDADGTCIPYGIPPSKTNDPTCEKATPSPGLAPIVQCEWLGPPAGDPTAEYVDIYSAPMVAELNLDLDPNKIQPSIVVTTFKTGTTSHEGILRVFDGRTCEEQMRIGGPDDSNADANRVGYATNWAIGDLDGDVGASAQGHPEIVGLHRVGNTSNASDPLQLVAFAIDTSGAKPKLTQKWLGHTCPGNQPVTFSNNLANYGPGLWDLDDDGTPEIVIDSMVFDANGCLLNPPVSSTPYLNLGLFNTVADVDLDGKPELVRFDGVYAWDTSAKQWQLESYFTPNAATQKPGHVAVVDVGQYSTISGKPATAKLPEIVVVSAATTTFNPSSTGSIRVQTLSGDVVFGPVNLYHQTSNHGGHGGPPTASDFDGDGQVEFAAAANEYYAVYDPDCTVSGPPAARPGGKCNKMNGSLPSGILWAQPSQDFSSSVTGSSLFDFDGDGTSEVIYGDECYVRVYDGPTGAVRFSAPASTGTGYELPVIADVDGDFATEIVAVRTTASSINCPSPDPLFPASGPWVHKGGFSILRDPQDRWVSSRPIWNQHAYSITHVSDDGRVVQSSKVLNNWEQPGMNNFRQNAQGELGKLALADLTVELDDLSNVCSGKTQTVDLSAKVCNRGTNPVQDGAEIVFYQLPKGDAGAPDGGTASPLCKVKTGTLLAPGDCTVVHCSGQVDGDKDVYVAADPDATIADCHPGNNVGAGSGKLCPTVR